MTRMEASHLLDEILAQIRRVEKHGGKAYQLRTCPEFFDTLSEAMGITGRQELGLSPEGTTRLFLTFAIHRRIMVREDPGISPEIGAYILGPETVEGIDNG